METPAQNAVDQIINNYNQEIADLRQLTNLTNDIKTQTGIINADTPKEHYKEQVYSPCGDGNFVTVTETMTDQSMVDAVDAASQKLNEDKQQLQSITNTLESLDGSTGLASLLSALNGLAQGASSSVSFSSSPTYLDASDLDKTFQGLVSMIKAQIKIDEKVSEVTTGGVDTINACLKIIELEQSESSTYQAIATALTNSLSSYNNAAGQEQTTIVGLEGSLFSPTYAIDEHEKQKRIDEERMAAIKSAQADLSSVGALVNTNNGFSTTVLEIDSLMEEVKKIMSDPNLSAQAKEGKLIKILQMVLSYLEILLQTADNLRTKGKEKIVKSNIEAAKLQLQTLNNATQTFAEIAKENKSMNIFHKILIGVEIAATIAFALTGNIGTAVALVTMTVLSVTGVLGKLTNDLGNAMHSQAGASATMMGISTILTLGAGMGTDLAMIAGSARAIEESIEEVVENEVKQEIQRLVAQEGTLSPEMTEQLSSFLEVSVKNELRTAAKSAVLKNYQASTVSFKFWQAFSPPKEVLQDSMEGIAKKSLEKALASKEYQAIKAGEASVVKSAKGTIRNGIKTNLKKAIFSGLYTMAATNLPIDLLTKYGNSHLSSSAREGLQIFLNLVEGLIEALSMMGGTGAAGKFLSEEGTALNKAATRAGTIFSTGSAVSQAGVGIETFFIDKNQASATIQQQQAQAVLNFFEEIRHLTTEKEPTSEGALMEEIKALSKNIIKMPEYIWNTVEAGSRALEARSV